MSRVYDNWERLVEAVLDREKLRELALCESLSSSISADFSSRFSFDSSLGDVSASRISNDTIDPGAPSSPSTSSYREAQLIALKEIRKATKNFRPDLCLGEGEFGAVFKGWIDERTLTASKPGFGTAIAVKRWRDGSMLGHQEWMKEHNYLNQLHHPNLVKLIGYWSKENEMMLIYEFMARGSLEYHLFRRCFLPLSWPTRIKVAKDVARGLSFLHGLEKQVIHPDLHCGRILLDQEFNAKLYGFILARDDDPNDVTTHLPFRVVDTHHYAAAPEYWATGDLTEKCNVYGFGVVLLELLFGHRARDTKNDRGQYNLVDWAKPFLGNKRKLLQFMDPRMEGQYSCKGAYKFATLASQCLSTEPKRRPRMAKVLTKLEQL